MPSRATALITTAFTWLALFGAGCVNAAPPSSTSVIPRTPDGKPDFQGIWQVRNRAAYGLLDHVARDGMPAGRGVVEGDVIPYQPWAAARQIENAANRTTADPLSRCYMPGVPRIMYMEFPFQIFQTREHVAITFEWSQVYRVLYLTGAPAPEDIDFWMGDSRARWDGDTLVVDVRHHNDKTWFDMAGNFHSDELHVVERYSLIDADTIQYEARITDPKVFTKPWLIRMPIHRLQGVDRLLEYQCNAEMEEANGAFERDPRTWYPGPSQPVKAPVEWTGEGDAQTKSFAPAFAETLRQGKPQPKGEIRRSADGKPDLNGYFMSDGGGANYGLAQHAVDFLTPPGRGIIVDPPDGTLPAQPWAIAEQTSRNRPERGYEDPTAHCFVAGVPRSMYVPSPMQILQTPKYVVILHERMAWRVVPLDGRPHLPETLRLWQGDSVGKWDGDVLVVETTNLNGKTWLNEVGEIVSHAERVVERFTPIDQNTIHYQATVSDPLVYTRPWTIAFAVNRQKDELLEVACHEDNRDLEHLKDVRDAWRAKQGRGGR